MSDETTPTEPQAPEQPATPPPAPDTSFDQAAVDAAAKKAAADAEKAATARLLETLGVDSEDAAKKLIAAQKAAEEASKDELQKAQEALAAAEAAAAAATAQAAQTAYQATAQARLIAKGVPATAAPLMVRLLDCEVDADAETIDAAIDERIEQGVIHVAGGDQPSTNGPASSNNKQPKPNPGEQSNSEDGAALYKSIYGREPADQSGANILDTLIPR